jgi:hypothetical protein
MAKLTSGQLAKRKKQSREAARAQIAKSEVMHFRLDPNSIQRIYAVAEKQRKNPGALVREWVLERLGAESGEGQTLEQRVTALEKLTAKLSQAS